MKTRTMITIGLSAFALTGSMICVATPGMIAAAASAENPKKAASSAAKARKAIAKRDAVKAVRYAEDAVAYAPQNAGYRALLGQAYLLSGRFASAKQALTDSLTLDSSKPAVALNLALAQIAQGDWQGARGTLEAHDDIDASDRGLAFALAGDPVKAVDILQPAARAADASAKTRQNLALSLALSGRWQEAKSVASIDLSPEQVDARIIQWAGFAKPANAYDQVASLLGVTPVSDPGQPVQLALVQPTTSYALAAAAPAETESYKPDDAAPVEVASADPSPVVAEAVTTIDPTPAAAPAETEIAGTSARVVFGPRAEIVQAIPASARYAAAAPASAPATRVATHTPAAPAPAAMPAKGNFYVQLGAFANAAVAHDSWRRVAQRVPEVGRHTPQGASVTTKAGSFYRLSVGGFARNDADALCRQVKATGGACFVRVAAGDAMASWVKGDTQVASR